MAPRHLSATGDDLKMMFKSVCVFTYKLHVYIVSICKKKMFSHVIVLRTCCVSCFIFMLTCFLLDSSSLQFWLHFNVIPVLLVNNVSLKLSE